MTTIKERILLYIENQGFNKESFFKDLELSYSNFKGKQKNTGLNSDTIVSILTKYPNLSMQWLLTGKGTMLNDVFDSNDANEVFKSIQEPPIEYEIKSEVLQAHKKTIEVLENVVLDLRSNNKLLQKIVEEKCFH